jgi:hypothetical protein
VCAPCSTLKWPGEVVGHRTGEVREGDGKKKLAAVADATTRSSAGVGESHDCAGDE